MMRLLIHDVRINVEKKGYGKPLVLLHGNEEDHHIFVALVKRLKEHFTCYLIDARNHGLSDRTEVFDYDVMASDLMCIMTKLNLVQPYFLGFSDGGIVGLLSAIHQPHLFDKMVICGANLTPRGIKKTVIQTMKKDYEQTKNPYIRMMLEQPQIVAKDLLKIEIPTLVVAGEYDVIHRHHTYHIKRHLPQSRLLILPHKKHDDYIVHRDDLFETLYSFFK